MKKLITVILTLALFATCLFNFGCKKPDAENPNDVVNETQYFMVERASTSYKIVTDSQASPEIAFAVSELQKFFGEATSISLQAVTAEGLSFDESSTYISLGENALAQKAGVSVADKGVTGDGFYIKTVNKSVFIMGATDYGTLNGVYRFLKEELNYEFYFTDTYSLDKEVISLTLKDYNVIDNPDIDRIQANHSYVIQSKENTYRYRMRERAGDIIPIRNNYTVHSILFLLPTETFGKDHPKWFRNNNLCFTAQGDDQEYNRMLDEALKILQGLMAEHDGNMIYIGQPDNTAYCGCEHCISFANQNGGTNSVTILRFCNDLSDRVYDWFDTEEGKDYARDFTIYFLAYQSVLPAPAQKDGNGNYVSTGIKCNEHVGVLFAADSWNYLQTPDHRSNQSFYEAMQAWRVVSNKFKVWIYDINFNNQLVPYESMRYKSDLYKIAYEMGANSIFDEANRKYSVASLGWCYLKTYLESKLRWDVNSDVQALTKSFFDVCYGPAGETMLEIYQSFRVYIDQLLARKEAGEISVAIESIFSVSANNSAAWDRMVLKQWLQTFDKAYAQIEDADIPKAEKERALRMLSTERISYIYLMQINYQDYLTREEFTKMANDLQNDLNNTGISSSNFSPITSTLEAFGISA